MTTVSISPGRDLFNTSPDQFKLLLEPDAWPRSSLIRGAVQEFNHRLTEVEGVWGVLDTDGTSLVARETSELRALRSWWTDHGLQLVVARREEDPAWERMPKRGRQQGSKITLNGPRNSPTTVKTRLARRFEALWHESVMLLKSHAEQTDTWLKAAILKGYTRPNSQLPLSDSQMVVLAVRHLYDADERNPLVNRLINGTMTEHDLTLPALIEAQYKDVADMANEGQVIGTASRIALAVAVALSEYDAADVYKSLGGLMRRHGFDTTTNLREFADLAMQ